MANSDCNLSPEGEFSLDDCDALLQFPYQDYAQNVKDEANDSDLLELGTSACLVLNGNDTTFFSDDDSQGMEHTSSPAVISKNFSQIFNSDAGAIDPSKIEKCIFLNRTLQQKLVLGMAKLVGALAKNKNKQNEVIQILRDQEKQKSTSKTRITKPISLFAAPYFRDVRGMVPPDNEDTKLKKKNNDVTAYLRPPRPWTLAEKDQLMHGIGANVLSYVLKPYKSKRDFLKSKMKDKNISDAEIAKLKKQVKRIERKMGMESERPYKDLIKEAKGNIDWMTISATNMEGLRTEEECELMWNNYLSIFVNKKRFTQSEDAQLRLLAEKYKGRNWDAIAQELNTNRSAVQCFERYQTKLSTTKLKKYFTPEEDAKLLNLIERYRVGKFIPWNKICGKMEGRARHQVINRYERTLCNEIKRGPWSMEEDAMILACVRKFGKHWTKMTEFLPGRSSYNIRERYVGHLDPDLRIGNWSKEEDIQLIKLIKKHGFGKWGTICKGLPGRTDNMCLFRARRVMNQTFSQKDGDEVDWGYDNVEEIVSLMKPVASTKTCHQAQNNRLRNEQNLAKETLKRGLEKVAELTGEIIDVEELDMSMVSSNTLRLLLKEFSITDTKSPATVWQPKYPTDYNRKYQRPMFDSRTTRRRKSNNPASGDDPDESEEDGSIKEESEAEGDFRLSHVEKVWLQKVLDNKYKEEASMLYNNNSKKKKSVCLNGEESMECSVYQTYLQKELLCQNYLGDKDVDNFVCGKVDYNVELAKVTHYFIQPPVGAKEMIVLPPNFSTLHGLDMVISTRHRLQRTANFVNHSLPYVRYVTGFETKLPKCLACTLKDQDASKVRTYEDLKKDMKSSLIVVDDLMDGQAKLETRHVSGTDQHCQCEALKNSKSQVDLLAKRFISMFLWPLILNSAGVREEQEELVYKKTPVQYDGNLPRPGRPPKRKAVASKNRSPKKKIEVEVPAVDEVTTPETVKPSRRSIRTCVLERKSFSNVVKEEDQA